MSAPLLDARGLRCPWPVLRLARAMREGEAAILLADVEAPAFLVDGAAFGLAGELQRADHG